MARILVVDDSPDILVVLRVTFEEAGHEVVTTENPLSVLGLLEREHPDALVLDIMMPGVTGWDLLEEVRARPAFQSLPIVMLSALSEVQDRVRGLRGGADDYQIKPFEPEELLARVEKLILNRSPAEPAAPAPPFPAPSSPPAKAPRPVLEEAIARLERRVAARAPLDDLCLGRFRVESVLGTGAMGTVLRGYDQKLCRPVALKTIRFNAADRDDRESLVSRLLAEAVSGAQLSHPNIVVVYDFEEEGRAAFIAMELVEGTNLEKHLAAWGRIAPRRLVPLAAAVARALAAAHENGIVHRDVKPGNVLLGNDGSIKVTDFGIAEYVSRASASERIFGTPGYLAPELMLGTVVSPASDLFALGVVLYECLSGRHPFVEKNWRRTLHNTAMRDPRPIAEVEPATPPRFAELVMRLLDKDDHRRPASAAAVAEVCEELSRAGGLAWSLEAPPSQASPVERRLPTTSRLFPLLDLRFQAASV